MNETLGPTRPGIELPQDIWEVVAHYLPDSEVLRLGALNRAMYNIALDQRYREVDWVDPDEKMVRLLKRLEEPIVASHVRRLHIRAWFMKRLLDIELTAQQLASPSTEPQPFKQKLISLLDTGSSRVRKNTQPPKVPPSSIGDMVGVSSPTKSILSAMAKAMNLMKNVREFDIEWRDLPFSIPSHSFLTSANQAFQTSLCKLHLSGHLSRLKDIIPLAIFRRLEEMELQFDYDERGEERRANNEAVLLDIVLPYINSHRGTLQSLKINSQADGDHSKFFHAFPHLRLLRRLILHIPFDRNDLSDPAVLHGLLRTHRYKLQEVEVLPNRVRLAEAIAHVKENWMLFTDFFSGSNDWLPYLKAFAIPSVTHARTISILQSMSPTVNALRLAHRYHSFKEVAEIVQIFNERGLKISKLSIDLITMTPKLFKLLAEKLPGLQDLTLVLEQAETSRRTFSELFPHYNSHTIDWNLTELSLYIKNYRDLDSTSVSSPTMQWEEFILMKTVGKIVPSIQYFKGQHVFSRPPLPGKANFSN